MVDLVVLVLVAAQLIVLFWSICRIISERNPNLSSATAKLLPQVKMETTPIEVSWKLMSYRNRLLTLQACVTDQVEVVTYRAIWGVNIESFHHVLQSPWQWFYEAFDKGNIFGSHSYDILDDKSSMIPTSEDTSKILDIQVPELNLGKAPRTKYPLVLVSKSNTMQSAFSIIVVHLEDKTFMNLNTHILASFVKLSDNRVSRLEHIYTASEEKDNCVICISKPATRVSLPCRHASTCNTCFKRLPKGQCPLCRSKITSYFVLSEEPQTEEPEPENTVRLTWRQKLAQLEERFAIATGLATDNE